MDKDPRQIARERREEVAKHDAAQQKHSITYTDDDGCEVTATPTGHVFYNAADWW